MKAQLGDVVPCDEAETLEGAVRLAAGSAEPGEAVLLAPACASWDMFRDYGERGDRFAAAARATGAPDVRAEGAANATDARGDSGTGVERPVDPDGGRGGR
jgi:hypothetical protein